MNGFENLPCLNVTITSQGLNGTVELSQYGEFTIQNNASKILCDTKRKPELTRFSVRNRILRRRWLQRRTIHGFRSTIYLLGHSAEKKTNIIDLE